jgi:rhodanese-related sulfurtransferase
VSAAIDAEEARRLIAAGEAKAVDFRDDEAWRENRITGAIRLTESDLDRGLGEVSEEVRLIVVAEEGQGQELADRLEERGRNAAYLEGSLDAWKDEDYPVQPSADPDEDAIV